MSDPTSYTAPARYTAPIFAAVFSQQRRALFFWAVALAAISAMYLSFYPSMGGDTMADLVSDLPEDMVIALGYDVIGTPGGWITSTVYGLLGPALLLIFAIGTGARLLAGEEEAGTLELEATAPVSRMRIMIERLTALIAFVATLVAVVTLVTWLLVLALAMDVPLDRILAGSAGLFLLILGFGSMAFAVGAATGSRAMAVGIAAALAVAAFMFDALGPVVEIRWMASISPFNWYLGQDPLIDGFDWPGLGRLATLAVAPWAVAAVAFPRRDLQV